MGSTSRRPVVKHLAKEQLQAFFGAIPRENIRDRLLFNLMYLHALRRGEAAILTLDDFWEDKIRVTRLKGGRSLTYPMFPSSLALLRRYLKVRPQDECPYLFRGRRHGGAPLAGRTIGHLFHHYATAAGLPTDLRHSHVLRHSLGTHLANEGVDISDAAEQLGHTELSSTAIYFEITDRRRRKVHRRMLRSPEIVRQ
jgi:integrase/recombinase XerD